MNIFIEKQNPAAAVLVGYALSSSAPTQTQQKRRLKRFRLLKLSANILYKNAQKIYGNEKESHIKRLNYHKTIKTMD